MRGQYLEELEALLGPRDRNYSLGGISFHIEGPEIFFPYNPTNSVVIRLGENALAWWKKDANIGIRLMAWQLAHECVHLIDPNFSPPTNVLEEGLATWFQDQKVEGNGFGSLDSYADAKRLVLPYIEKGHLLEKVRILREEGIRICDIRKEDLHRVASQIYPADVKALTERFVR